jgi:uncharacterized protein (DUF1810 family)
MESNRANDPYNLERFMRAQDPVFAEVCSELQNGTKIGHWMWFIFPQLKGLGSSEMSIKFAIASREEAEAYLTHIVLGPRLKECARLVLLIEGTFGCGNLRTSGRHEI